MVMVSLAHETPIKSGGEKLVFLHPLQPGQLIKIVNPRYISYMYKTWPILTRFRRLSHYWFYLKELTEHIAARARGVPDLHHLQNITGLVDTDLGLGMVMEAVLRRDGQLAHTLGDLLENGGFGAAEQAAFTEFCCWLTKAPLIVRDLSVHNLVWHEQGQYFVVIDGVGGKARPTLRSFSSRYNLRSNRLKVEKLQRRVAGTLNRQQLKALPAH